MPVKRRVAKRRISELNLNQEEYLECGHFFFSHSLDEFEDDAHVRAAWEQHRDRLMAADHYPGKRPWAYWQFDQAWPAGSESEADAVHKLPDTTPEERAKIEENWLNWVRVAASNAASRKAPDRECAFQDAAHYGVPRWFFEQTYDPLYERHRAESEAWQRKIQGVRDN